MYKRFIVGAISCAFFAASFSAQTFTPSSRCDSSIVVSGWVFEPYGGIIPTAMAVNRESGGGVFVERDGSFLVRACPEILDPLEALIKDLTSRRRIKRESRKIFSQYCKNTFFL